MGVINLSLNELAHFWLFFYTNPCRPSEPHFGVHLAAHVGDVSGPAYCTVRGVAALDVFVCSPAAVSADLAALVVAGGYYVLPLEAAAQLAADFALPVRTPPVIEGA